MNEYSPVQITNVNIKPINNVSKSDMKGYCDITFNDLFKVTGIKLMAGKEGLYLKYPVKKSLNDRFYQIFAPGSAVFGAVISDVVIKRYLEMLIMAAA